MAFLNTDIIGDIDSLSSEQCEENVRNLNAIESLNDVYKTYKPLPRAYWLSSSSTSTLKADDAAITAESIEGNEVQETVTKVVITNTATENSNAAKGQGNESKNKEEQENNNKTPSSRKEPPPPPPPRPRPPPPSLVTSPTAPKETKQKQAIPNSDSDKYFQMRIASGEITRMQTNGTDCHYDNSIDAQYSNNMNTYQVRNTVKFMESENGQQGMTASDYYAQQLAMQMSNPVYSYGGYGQSQLLSAAQGYQFQSPEMDYYNYAQLQGYLPPIDNYGQYASQGMPGGTCFQTQGSGFGQYNQYQYMAGGGGKSTECHSCSCPVEERSGTTEDSAESSSADCAPCCGKTAENCSCSETPSSSEENMQPGRLEDCGTCCPRRLDPGNMDACCTFNCCPGNPNSCFPSTPCPDPCYSCPGAGQTCSENRRGFEMPECMPSMPQCRVGNGQCCPPRSRFSIVDVNAYNNLGNMCHMEMPNYGGMQCCMAPPNSCCSAPSTVSPPPPPPSPCGCMPCCSSSPPPQWCQMSCCSPPPLPCGPMPCCSPTPECCACSGNCLNIEGFLQKIRAAQRQCCCSNGYTMPTSSCCYSSRPSPREQTCCGDDRLQSQTVYAADYQPFCGRGNNFNHFPKCDSCGSCGSSGACCGCMGLDDTCCQSRADAIPICMPAPCCAPPCRAASGGCFPMPSTSCSYEQPNGGASYGPACSTAPYAVPCSSPSPTTANCPTSCSTPCSNSCFSTSCQLPYEMPLDPCVGSSPFCNAVSQATSCNLTQCASFS